MKSFAVLLSMVIVLFSATTAFAATTVYTDSSNFGPWPNALNSGNALGPANGVSAFIPNGGWVAFQETPTFTAGNISLTFTSVTGAGTAFFYVGQSNGAGWFTALNSVLVTLTTGANLLTLTPAQSAFCTGLGGCDVFVVQAFGGGTTLALDSAIGPNPEPSAWALMILGFIGVAGRLKALRRNNSAPAVIAPAHA